MAGWPRPASPGHWREAKREGEGDWEWRRGALTARGGRPSRLLRSASIRCRRRFTFVTRCGFDSLMRASMALLSRSLGFDACTMHGLARLDFAGLFLSPHRRHRAWASLRGASRPPRSLGLWRHGVGRDERERGNGGTSDATLTIRIHAVNNGYARPRTAGRFADAAP